MADNPFEIPQSLRDLAEQNTKQVHAAYEQLTDFVTKAMSAWMGTMPSNAMSDGFKGVQERAVQLAKENAESAFAWADKLAKVQNFQEVLTLQTQFAQDRMHAFVSQTQELYRLTGESLQKMQRG